MDPYKEHTQRLADITLESNFALWNALLTLNGIIVSVFSAVAIFEEKIKPLAFLIVAGSIISSALIILNIQTTRDLFRRMGSLSLEQLGRLSEEEKKRQLESSAKKHNASNLRERVSYVILTLQALMILALIYWKK